MDWMNYDYEASSDEEDECIEISVNKFKAVYDAIISGERFIDEQLKLTEELQCALKETYESKLKLEAENEKLKWKLRAYIPATPIYNFFKKMKKIASFQEAQVRSLSNWCRKFRNGCKQQALQIKNLKAVNAELKQKMEASEMKTETLEKEMEAVTAAFISAKRSAMKKIKDLEEKLEASTANTRTATANSLAVDWFPNENVANETIDLTDSSQANAFNFTPAAPSRTTNMETINFSFSKTPFTQQRPSQPFRTPRFNGSSNTTVRTNRTSARPPLTIRSRRSNFSPTPLEDGVPIFKSARTLDSSTTRNSSGWDPSREFREGTTTGSSLHRPVQALRLPVNLDAQMKGSKPLLLTTVNKSSVSTNKFHSPMMPGAVGKQRIVPNFLKNLK